MKKFLLPIIASIAILFAGCQSDNTSDNMGDSVVVADGKTIVSIEMPQTRTYLGEKQGNTYPVYWSEGDKIAINNVLSSSITINKENPASAKFTFDEVLNYPYYITHNYMSFFGSVWNNNAGLVWFSQEQTEETINSFQPNSMPMYSIVEKAGNQIKLEPLTGVLRFSVKAESESKTLTQISINALSGEPISGYYMVNPLLRHMLTEQELEAEGFSLSKGLVTSYQHATNEDGLNFDYINYSCDTTKPLTADKAREFFITIPEGNLGLLRIVFTTSDGEKMYCLWNAINIQAGYVREFKTMTFKPNDLTNITLLEPLESEDATLEVDFPNIFGYVKDNSGNPIQGVAVSDGFSVVTTDENGYYEMSPSSDCWYIFISLPSEYEVPINNFGQPCFYQKYPSDKQQYDFTLTPLASGKEEKFALFAIADPQIWKESGFKRFKNEAIPGIASHCNEVAATMPCYGITLGDLISNTSTLTGNASEYREPIRTYFSKSKIGMPVFQVMGNHDCNYTSAAAGVITNADERNSSWQIKMQRDHEQIFGPANYSFNRGDVHIVGMRNIMYKRNDSYSSELGFSDEQVEWLRQDLAQVSKDKMVVLCVHIPMQYSSKKSVRDVLNLINQFSEAHILSGHNHYNQNYEHATMSHGGIKVYEHLVNALCGSWWESNMSDDGTPVGYQVFISEGAKFSDWYYMGYTNGMNTRNHQMRLYRGNAVTGAAKSGTDKYGVKGYYKFNYGEDVLLANVYNADSAWKVEVYEDGEYSGDMELIPNLSRPYHNDSATTASENIGGDGSLATPYYSMIANISSDMHFVGLYMGILGKKDGEYNTGGDCFHMYKYHLKNKDAKIMVKAIDRFKNEYTETNITTGTDYSITGL